VYRGEEDSQARGDGLDERVQLRTRVYGTKSPFFER
jgi:hypothetical protein